LQDDTRFFGRPEPGERPERLPLCRRFLFYTTYIVRNRMRVRWLAHGFLHPLKHCLKTISLKKELRSAIKAPSEKANAFNSQTLCLRKEFRKQSVAEPASPVVRTNDNVFKHEIVLSRTHPGRFRNDLLGEEITPHHVSFIHFHPEPSGRLFQDSPNPRDRFRVGFRTVVGPRGILGVKGQNIRVQAYDCGDISLESRSDHKCRAA
jgi:hypothetical protein